MIFFTRYSTAVESLLRVLVDVQEKERVARSYQSELDVRCLFHEEFAGRIRSMQKLASPSAEPTPTPTPQEKPLESSRVTGPNTSGKSTYPCSSTSGSGLSKASQARLAVAQLKMKKLKDQQRLKERQHELERERLRVEMEMELLNARSDAEQAKIELSLVNVGSEGLADRPAEFVDLPMQILQETVGKYFESCDNEVPRISPTPLQQPERILPVQQFSHLSAESIDTPEVQRLLQLQQEAMKCQDETVRLVATGLGRLAEMPKRELISFDGDPMRYPRFIKGFEINVERRVKDHDKRLSFLIQYCRGAAKEVIANCIMLPPEQGYREAKDILRKNFGQKHIVVRAFIDKVVKGPQIRASESDKLSQLVRDMKNCILNSEHMHYKADINSMETLRRVVMRLPPHLQAKWAEESSRLIESGMEPEFSHLAEFGERRAVVANTAFGKLVGTKPDGEKSPKPVKLRMAGDQAVKATTLATQVSNSHQKSDRLRAPGQANGAATQASTSVALPSTCLFCDGSHALGKCFRFRDKSYKDRKDFVLNKRLCMNCLRENHIARQCRWARACMFSGCSRRHHSLLHPPPIQGEASTRVDDRDAQLPAPQNPSSASGAGEEGQFTAIGSSSPRVGFRIVPVKVRGCDGGTEVETYAFLDNGSDTTLCLIGLAQRLVLNGTLKLFSLSSINSENTPRMGYEVALDVSALNGDGNVRLDKV